MSVRLSFAVGDYRPGSHYLVHHRYGTLGEAQLVLDELHAGKVQHRLAPTHPAWTPHDRKYADELARNAGIVVEVPTAIYDGTRDLHVLDGRQTLCGEQFGGKASATGYEPLARVTCPSCIVGLVGDAVYADDCSIELQAGYRVEVSS